MAHFGTLVGVDLPQRHRLLGHFRAHRHQTAGNPVLFARIAAESMEQTEERWQRV